MKIRLFSNQLKSQSLKRLAEGLSTKLGYKVWRSSKIKPHRIHLLYGDQKGKLDQYLFFQEQKLPIPPFTTSKEEACSWLSNPGNVVVCRTLTHSSEGKGIILAETPDEIAPAPVYTLYKKKKKEFRVHVFRDKVVSVLEKRRKKDWNGQTDSKIRNTANGYVFCSGDVVEPDGLRELALRAAKVTKSDFKGVDIGYNEKLNELFVIEVNSAPGIEGSNVTKYIEEIVKHV